MRTRLATLAIAFLLLGAGTAQAIPPEPLPRGCEGQRPPPSCFAGSPTGRFDAVRRLPDGLHVDGTAQDPDTSGPVSVSVLVDGRFAGTVAATGTGGGFSGVVPAVAGEQVCAVATNRGEGEDRQLGCHRLAVRVDPIGFLDGADGPGALRVTGWAIDPDSTGPVPVDVSIDGTVVHSGAAQADRPDVGAAHPGYGPLHGLDVSVPATGHPIVCLTARNVGPGADATVGCTVARPGPPPAPTAPDRLTVATLNIIGTDTTALAAGLPSFAERLDAMASAVAGFDIVGLQEVYSGEQVRRLAERAGYPFWTVGVGVSGRPDAGFMSRTPLTGSTRHEGPKPGCWAGINCGGPVWILVATTVVHGKAVRVVNTHLSGDYSPQGLDRSAWRAAQARFISDELVKRFPGRVIVVGDFNGNDDLVTAKGGPLLDAAAEAPTTVLGPGGEGHCGDRIDLILIRPPMQVLAYDGVYGGLTCSPAGVSDHPRVAAVLALGPDPDPPAPVAEPQPPKGPAPQVCRSKPWTPGCEAEL